MHPRMGYSGPCTAGTLAGKTASGLKRPQERAVALGQFDAAGHIAAGIGQRGQTAQAPPLRGSPTRAAAWSCPRWERSGPAWNMARWQVRTCDAGPLLMTCCIRYLYLNALMVFIRLRRGILWPVLRYMTISTGTFALLNCVANSSTSLAENLLSSAPCRSSTGHLILSACCMADLSRKASSVIPASERILASSPFRTRGKSPFEIIYAAD